MFPAQPCAACLCVMEAPCMCQSGRFGLGFGIGESWWVGSWHGHGCPNSGLSKTHRFNPDYDHHFSLFPLLLSVFPSIDLPSSLLPHPRIHCLPLSCCSFSCSCLTLPSQPYKAYPKKKKNNAPRWLVCCHGDHSCHFFSVMPLISSEWSLRVDF